MSSAPRIVALDARESTTTDLTEFGFTTTSLAQPEAGQKLKGKLITNDDEMEIEFRVRSVADGKAKCTFIDLSIADKSKISKFLKQQKRAHSANAELESRTYDELAQGIISSSDNTTAQTTSNSPAEAPRRGRHFKSLAMMFFVLTLCGMAVLAALFLKSRSTLSISNSSLVGNYLPVHAKVEGEIVEVCVGEGDYVKKGQVLMRLDNAEIRVAKEEAMAKLATAQAKTDALTKKLESYKVKVDVATKKLAMDLEVAKQECAASEKMVEVAKATVERMEPYAENGAVTQLEMNEATNELLAIQAEVIAAKNRVRQIEFSQNAAKQTILILGDRLDDEIGRIVADLDIAKAERIEYQHLVEIAEQQESQLTIVAPRDGQVFASYRQFGEYLRLADEAIALTYPGKTWAAGMVTAGQASRIRPGQPVRVVIPSLDERLQGVVTAVGHRAMYSKGNYSADFRGTTATDVPVKVVINDLPEEIPSGIRLEMAINTGFGIQWLDNSIGYELLPVSDQQRSNVALKKSGANSKSYESASLTE